LATSALASGSVAPRPYQDDGCVGPLLARDLLLEAPPGEGQKVWVAAERPAVPERQARVAQLLALERGGDVALAVPGGHEHERDDVDRAVARPDQPLHGVLDGRRRQLEEAAGDVRVRRAQLRPVDELGELRTAGRALGAVADDEQGRTGHGLSS
jgi:hypothetical protein